MHPPIQFGRLNTLAASRSSGRSRKRSRRGSQLRRSALEPLEPRLLLTSNVWITANVPSVLEASASPGEFTVSRDGDTSAALPVSLQIGGTAVNGTNYEDISSTVTIPAGQSTAVIDVDPITQLSMTGNLTVDLTVAAGSGYNVATPSSAEVTIDDNPAAPGTVDTSFGTSGTALLNTAGSANALVQESNGDFLALQEGWQVVSFNANGTLDTNFGDGGVASISFGGTNDQAYAMALQPDGKIVVAGETNVNGVYEFAVARFNPDGTIDTSFGSSGEVITSLGSGTDMIYSVAIQSNGQIVVAGRSNWTGFALSRYNSDGSLDTTFGDDGTVVTPNGLLATGLAIDASGNLVVAGSTYGQMAVARYTPDGTLDSTFGTDGIATISTPGATWSPSVAVEPDGQILVSGTGFDGTKNDFGLMQFNSDGSVDTTFGDDGVVLTSVGTSSDIASAMALQANGKILVAGTTTNTGSASNFAVARYNANGSLDPTFGNDGVVVTTVGSGNNGARGVVVQPSGTIVAAGYTSAPAASIGLVRYIGDEPIATALANVTVNENSENSDLTVTDSFVDPIDPTAALSFSIAGDTNPLLFSSLSIDNSGNLTIAYAAGQSGSATITVQATDPVTGYYVDSPFTVTVNAAPVSIVPAPQATLENTALAFSAGNGDPLTLSAVSAESADVEVSLAVVNGTLTLGSTTNLANYTGNGTNAVCMEGTLANVNNALAGLIYSPTAGYIGPDDLTIHTRDAGYTGGVDNLPMPTQTNTVALAVLSVNSPPVNVVPSAQSTQENVSLVFSSATSNPISANDCAVGSLPVQVTLTATNGTLLFNHTAGLTFVLGGASGDGAVQFSGTISSINAALNGLTFLPSNDFVGLAVLTLTTDDLGNAGLGGDESTTNSVDITVSPVDQAPVISVPASATAIQAAYVFSTAHQNAITVSDIDADGAEEQVDLQVQDGLLTLNTTTGLTFTVGNGSSNAAMTFAGTLANINAALNGLTYTPTNFFNGQDTLSIAVDDDSSLPGGPLTVTKTVPITVNGPFSLSGSTLTVTGVALKGTFELAFTNATTFNTSYEGANEDGLSTSAITNVIYDTGGGNDSVYVWDEYNTDTALFNPNSMTLTHTGFSLAVTSGNYIDLIGSFQYADTATFGDSSGTATITSAPGDTSVSNTGYKDEANNFGHIVVNAPGATATLTGTTGSETFQSSSSGVILNNPGADYDITVNSCASVTAIAGGPSGRAVFNGDSSGSGYLFTATGISSASAQPINGNSYDHVAEGFSTVVANSINTNDIADLYGTSVNDTVTSNLYSTVANNTTVMSGSGFSNTVNGFSRAYAYNGTGTTNQATLNDYSGSASLFTVPTGNVALLQTSNALAEVYNFTTVYATAPSGNSDTANMYDVGGADEFVGEPGAYSEFEPQSGSAYIYKASDFLHVNAYRQTGGSNVSAQLTDATGSGSVVGVPRFTSLTDGSAFIYTQNFPVVDISGGSGSSATFYGSGGASYNSSTKTMGAIGAEVVLNGFSNTKVNTNNINETNDAPVITGSAPVFPSVTENESASSDTGITVLNLLGTGSSGTFTDANDYGGSDFDLRGIAVTGFGTNTAYGTWEYSNGGGIWTALSSISPAISQSNALLLNADGIAALRFVPATNFSGTIPASDGLTFQAWDETSNSPNATANGGSTAFSTGSVTLTVTVNPIPIYTASAFSETVNQGSQALVSAWAQSIQAAPTGDTGQFAITNISNPNLFAVEPTVSSTGVLSFTASSTDYGTATMSVAYEYLSNGTVVSTSAPQSLSINVNYVDLFPQATILQVDPSPRNKAISSISIVFSQPVTGFGVSNLTLTDDGQNIPLTTSQQPTSSDGGTTWTVPNLFALTGSVGTYTLAVTDTGIKDAEGYYMVDGTSMGWTVNNDNPVLALAADEPTGAQVFTPAEEWSDPLTGDFTGTGATDLLDIDPTTGDINVAVPQAAGGFIESQWGALTLGVTWQYVQVADVIGNGRDDLIAFDQNTGQWYVEDSNGTSFTLQPWGNPWESPTQWVNVKVGDFNGDGRADIVAEQVNTGNWYVSLSTGTSFTDPDLWILVSGINDWSDTQVLVGDFVGDTRSDLAIFDPDTGDLHVEVSTGTYFADQVWAVWQDPSKWQNFMVGDFNGDGKADIIAREPSTGDNGDDIWQIASSTGSSFTTITQCTPTTVGWTNFQVANLYSSPVSGLLGEIGNEWEAIVAPETSMSADQTGSTINDWSSGNGTSYTTVVGIFQTPLQDAIADFAQVRNDIQFQPYYGEMKGPTATAETGEGNAWDQAAYLQELLQADGMSADVVSGEVEASAETVAQWLGATSSTGVPNIPAAIQILADANLFVGTSTAANGDTMIEFLDAWVAASLPGPTGMTTIDLDPSWKFDDLQPGISNILSTVPFNLADYYTDNDPSQTLVYEYYENQVLSYLASADPGDSLADVPHTGPIIAQTFTALPSTYSYTVISDTVESAFPSSEQHQFLIALSTQYFQDPLSESTNTWSQNWSTVSGGFSFQEPAGSSGVPQVLTSAAGTSLALVTSSEIDAVSETIDAAVSYANGSTPGLVNQYAVVNGVTEYYLGTLSTAGVGALYFVSGSTATLLTPLLNSYPTVSVSNGLINGSMQLQDLNRTLSLYFNGELIDSATSTLDNNSGQVGLYSSGSVSFSKAAAYNALGGTSASQQWRNTAQYALSPITLTYETVGLGGPPWDVFEPQLEIDGQIVVTGAEVDEWSDLFIVIDQYDPGVDGDTVTGSQREAGQDVAVSLDALQASQTYLDQLQETVNSLELQYMSALSAGTSPPPNPSPVVAAVLAYAAADYNYLFEEQAGIIAGLTDAIGVVNRVGSGLVTDDISSSESPLSTDGEGEISDVYVPTKLLIDLRNTAPYVAVPLAADTDPLSSANLPREQMIAYNASSLENEVVEQIVNAGATSTMSGFHAAVNEGISIETFNPAATSLQQFETAIEGSGPNGSYSASMLQDVESQFSAGYTITLPLSPVQLTSSSQGSPLTFVGMVYWKQLVVDTTQSQLSSATFGYIIDDGSVSASGGVQDGSSEAPSAVQVSPQLESGTESLDDNAGDPINVVTGTVTHTETDVSLPNFSLPLTFSREYDSYVTTDSGLGIGWMDNYSDTLTLGTSSTGASTVTWNTSTGQQYTFTDDNGTYQSPTDLFGTLTFNSGNGIYTYTDTTGLQHSFGLVAGIYRLLDIEDRNQNELVVAWNTSLGRINSVTANSGESLAFGYNGNSLDITSVSDSTGRTWNYTYETLADGKSYLKTATNPLQQTTQYSYYEGGALDGLIQQITDPDNGSYTYTYYPDRRGFEVIDPDGGMTHVSYDLYRSTTSYTDQNGNTSLTIYNSSTGLVSEQISPDQSRDIYTWNPSNLPGDSDLMVSHTNAIGEVETYSYNTTGQLTGTQQTNIGQTSNLVTEYDYDTIQISVNNGGGSTAPLFVVAAIVVNPGAGQEETDYENFDSHGNARTTIDAAGDKTTMTYGSQGQLLTEVEPNGYASGGTPGQYTTTYTYNLMGQVTSVTSPQVTVLSSGYNNAGQWTMSFVDVTPVTTYTYDSLGDLLSTTNPDGTTTSYTYNLLGQVRTQIVSSPSGTSPAIALKTYYSYDADGNLISTTDPLNLVTKYTYNLMNQLIQTTFDDGTFTSESYDGDGNVVSATNALGQTTQYVYNSENRQVQVLYADDSTTLTRYNATGQVLASTDADGNTTTYSYDLLGHVLTTTNALCQTTANSYDIFGNLHTTIDAIGAETTYDYDLLNRLIETDGPDGLFETTTYDADGNVTDQIRYNVTGYSYAENGTSRGNVPVDLSSLPESLQQITQTQYNPLNEPIKVIDPTGAVTNTIYDAAGHVVMTIDPLGNETLYGYDSVGRKTTVTQMVPDSDGSLRPGPTTTTAYDADGNVTSVTDANGAVYTYTYDALNRQTSETLSTDPTGALSGALISATGYDAAGNPVVSVAPPVAGQTYDDIAYDRATLSVYNDRNEAIEVIGPHPDAAATEAAPLTTKQYDANGNVIASTDADGNVTYYAYNALNELVSQSVPQAAPTSETPIIEDDVPQDLLGPGGALPSQIPGPAQLNPNVSISGTATWHVQSNGLNGESYATQATSTGGSDVNWSFEGLTSGTYEVYASWDVAAADAPDADFTVSDANGVLGSSTVNESLAAVGRSDYCVTWQSLGEFSITTGSALVQLSNKSSASDVWVDADGIMLIPVSGPSTTYTYNAEGDVTSTTDPLGNTTSYQYNYSGQKTLVTQPNPGTPHPNGPGSPQTAYQYNALGALTLVTDPMLNTTAYTYDADGRQLTVTDPNPTTGQALNSSGDPIGPTTTYAYDLDGNLTSTTDPMGNNTEYVYNALNEKVEEIQPNPANGSATGPETFWTYDNMGNVVATTDALGYTTDYVYDALGRQTQVIEPSPTAGAPRPSTSTSYDDAGDVKSTTDANGNTTQYLYDNLGRKVEEIDPVPDPKDPDPLPAPVTTYMYDANGNLTSSLNTSGQFTFDTYDAQGQQTGATTPQAPIDVPQFGPAGSEADFEVTGLTAGTYEVLAQWSAASSLSPAVQYLTLSAFGEATLATSTINQTQPPNQPDGWQVIGTVTITGDEIAVVMTSLDGQSLDPGSIEVAMTSGPGTTSTYNADGELASTTDANGNVTYYTYDALGRQMSVSVPAQPQTQTTVTVQGTDSTQSGSSTYDYQATGLTPGMYEVLVTWDPSDGLSQEANYSLDEPNLWLAGFTLDQTQNPDPTGANGGYYLLGTFLVAGDELDVQLISGDGLPTYVGDLELVWVSNVAATTRYNADSEVTSTTDPLGNVTSYSYNALGEKTVETDPNPNDGGYTPQETWTYNADGQMLTSTVTPNAGGTVDTTSYAYNDLGQQISVTNPDGDTTTYTYDALGQMTSETDADGNMTAFVYDSLGRLMLQTSPTGAATYYTYDAAGQELTVTDPDGRVTAFTYDQLGRTISESFYVSQAVYDNGSGSPEETQTWTYNAAGQLASESDQVFDGSGSGSTSTTSYTYDAFGRLASETQTETGAPTTEFDYTYDANGNVWTETDLVDGARVQTTTYSGYNGLNLPATMVVASAAATLTVDYQYSTTGQTTGMTRYQNGDLVDTTTYTFNGDGDLKEELVTGPGGGTLEDFQYVYNGEGEILQAMTPTTGYVQYTYDPAGQLTSATYPAAPWANESYSYDAAGNRLTTTTGSTSDDTLATNPSTTTTGNELTSDGTFVYEYDAAGNLVYQARVSPENSADDQMIYSYNNLNELTEVVTEDNGDNVTQTVTYTYNAQGERVSESVTVGGSTTTTFFAYDAAGNLVLSFDSSGDVTGQYVYGQAVDQLLAQKDSSGDVSWMVTDRDQSVRDVLQSSGGVTSVIDHIDYNSFGETIDETDHSVAHLTGYAGYINDLALGMLETDSRVYDATTGRFISQDPSGFSGSPNGNLYEYAGNSPLDNVDPSGLSQQNPLTSVASSMPTLTGATLSSVGDSNGDGVNDITGEQVGTSSEDDDAANVGTPITSYIPLGSQGAYSATTLGNINVNTGLSPDDPDYAQVAEPTDDDLQSLLLAQATGRQSLDTSPAPDALLSSSSDDLMSYTDESQAVLDSLGDDLYHVSPDAMSALLDGQAQLQNSNVNFNNLTQNAVIGLTGNYGNDATLTFTFYNSLLDFSSPNLLGYPHWELTGFDTDQSPDEVVSSLQAAQSANYAMGMSMGGGMVSIQGGIMTAAFALPGLFSGTMLGAAAGAAGLFVGAGDAGAGAVNMATGGNYQPPLAAGTSWGLQTVFGVSPSTADTWGGYVNTGVGMIAGMIGTGSWELNTNPYSGALETAANGADAAVEAGSLETLDAQSALQEEIVNLAPTTPVTAPQTIGSLLGALPDGAYIHLTPATEADLAASGGVMKQSSWVQFGDVADMSLADYKANVVMPKAAAYGPGATQFVVKMPSGIGPEPFVVSPETNLAGITEFNNTAAIKPSMVITVPRVAPAP